MKNLTINGISTIKEGEYDRIRINGSGTIKGNVKFDDLVVNGITNCDGAIEGNFVEIDGSFKTTKDIKTKKMLINGTVKSTGTKIYADEIEINGSLKGEGEVSADIVHVDGSIVVESLHGDKININYADHMNWNNFGITFFSRHIQDKLNNIKEIECSQLKAGLLTCDILSAHDITLNKHCKIGVINCDGVLRFDDTCTITTINGKCTIEKI